MIVMQEILNLDKTQKKYCHLLKKIHVLPKIKGKNFKISSLRHLRTLNEVHLNSQNIVLKGKLSIKNFKNMIEFPFYLY